MNDPHLFKIQLLEHCKELLMQRINTAESAMHSAQEAANGEEKSSAGDKYETSRAMGHLDRDMNAKQLVKAREELHILEKIDPAQSQGKVILGSLVICERQIYFIAVGLGMVELEKNKVAIVSPLSPLARELMGKPPGSSFSFNQQQILIREIL